MRSPSAPTADVSRPGVIRRTRYGGELRLWDASTGRLLLPPIPHTNWVAALAFQPDGKVVAVGDYDGLVRFWDTSTGKEIGRPLPQGEMVLCLAYSPDGTMLAVGLASEQRARLVPGSGTTGRVNPSENYCPARSMSPDSNSGRMVEPCLRVAAIA